MRAACAKHMALARVALACVSLSFLALTATAAVTPDPGGAGAWGAGLALLADHEGPLSAFDQPARLAGKREGPPATIATTAATATSFDIGIAGSRARLFELDALARSRLALGVRAGAWGGALGLESFGPPEARRWRALCALALRRSSFDVGASWNEWRSEGAGDRANRGGSLDLALVARGPRGFTGALALRALAAGGHPIARPDPDWTLEVAWRTRPVSAFLAVTRDLAGSRAGGGLALVAGPLSIRAGAVGAPWCGSLAILFTGRVAGHAHANAGYARVSHPSLGLSEEWEGGIEW
ncbi:MAG: hypothetical protein ACREOU_03060 [Candidatus Eiseniibacteriota bacterium]